MRRNGLADSAGFSQNQRRFLDAVDRVSERRDDVLKRLETAHKIGKPTSSVAITGLSIFTFVDFQVDQIPAEHNIIRADIVGLANSAKRDFPSVIIVRD